MKKIILLATALYLNNTIAYSQSEFIDFNLSTKENKLQKIKAPQSGIENKDILFLDICKNIQMNKSILDKQNIDYSFATRSLKKDEAIIVIYSKAIITNEEAEKSKIMVSILHKNNETDRKWDEYLLNTKKILLVLIGDENNLQDAHISIEKEKSWTEKSWGDLAGLVNLIEMMGLSKVSGMKNQVDSLSVRYVFLKKEKVRSPCFINVTYSSSADPIAVKIHEKNYIDFQVGVSASQLSKNQFKIQNKQLIVSLNDDQKKEWKSNLNVLLNIFPFGRDIDRVDPIFMLKIRDKKIGPAAKEFIKNRIGVHAGMKLSSDPIESFYFGLNLAFSQKININAGWSWINTIRPAVYDIGDITTLANAMDYVNRQYSGHFYWGVSFSPSAMVDILGLKKKESK